MDLSAPQILHARIVHVRLGPKQYQLAHRLWYLAQPLSALSRLDRPLMRLNRRGMFSLCERDYGDGQGGLKDWVARAFALAGRALPDGEIVLVSLPRTMGFGFNPVSFWLCHDASGALRAVLVEVNNTFGERHCYVASKPDGSIIRAQDLIGAEKVFHVSPFLPVAGRYAFRFAVSGERIAIRVDVYDAEGKRVLITAISGRLAPMTVPAVAAAALRYPLPVAQVVGFIHWHALKLWRSGLAVFSKPAPPAALVSSAEMPIRSSAGKSPP